MKEIKIDIENLSPGQIHELQTRIVSFLSTSAARIREDLHEWGPEQAESIPGKQMQGWGRAADEQAKSVSKQFHEANHG